MLEIIEGKKQKRDLDWTNKEITKEYQRKWDKQFRDKNPDYAREKHLKTRFGLTIKEWNEMFDNQNGCCAICSKHQSEVTQRFVVDHTEEPEFKVRGLLCHCCNLALGGLGDNLEGVLKAVKYLSPDWKV
jgi:hypothetical protein